MMRLGLWLGFIAALPAFAQHQRGELRLDVRDQSGAGLSASADLLSDRNQIHRTFATTSDGHAIAQDLPFGVYSLTITRQGFQPSTQTVAIPSEIPVGLQITLGVTPLETHVDVAANSTLLDPNRAGAEYSVGAQSIREHLAAQPGRGLLDMINDQPGWVYEANGSLHPRGSEYGVQFVIDGVPVTQNRSPAFAPLVSSDEPESLEIRTSGYPAEYGRKLGGVVEITTPKDAPPGLSGEFAIGGGSFDTTNAFASLVYGRGPDRFSLSGNAAITDRYLDPPSLANYTNHGSTNGVRGSYSRELTPRDRLRISLSHDAVQFLVPNELVQQQAGQRQDRTSNETALEGYYQRVISPALLFDAQASFRKDSAALWSNPDSTPILAAQQRGFTEGYTRADLAGFYGLNHWKTGADAFFSSVHEALQYTITDPTQFDPGTAPQLQFATHHPDREQSAYVQDELHWHNWNASLGVRFDHYSFAVEQSAWSPRVGVSRFIPKLNLSLHASYDRVFQTPAMENLLLASSPILNAASDTVVRLPVHPAFGNYYELGISKSLWSKLRIDATVFRRDFRDYPDDDVLLNTGVSFPIAFAAARIRGEEIKIEVPRWGRFSGFVSYANQLGIAHGPITGGLFLGSDAAAALSDNSRFYVSQDVRNTFHFRTRMQVIPKAWISLSGAYASGLPADNGVSGADYNFLLAQYGPQILSRVDLDKGRLRPSFSLDAAAGIDLYRKERKSVSWQIEGANLMDRLNVINFASLFSGTAVGPPRSVTSELRIRF